MKQHKTSTFKLSLGEPASVDNAMYGRTLPQYGVVNTSPLQFNSHGPQISVQHSITSVHLMRATVRNGHISDITTPTRKGRGSSNNDDGGDTGSNHDAVNDYDNNDNVIECPAPSTYYDGPRLSAWRLTNPKATCSSDTIVPMYILHGALSQK
jgi:hypothetical protein